MKFTLCFCLAALAFFLPRLTAEIVVTSTKIDGQDAAFGADASDSDLVNAGAPSLFGVELSDTPFFGPEAHNDGTVGAASETGDILFWLNAAAGSTYSVTYTLDTTAYPDGYDLTSIRTIHGWTNASGYQKNQTYEVLVSLVGEPGFDSLTTVGYTPYGSEVNVASTKVDLSEDATGVLVSGVDAVRFTYTVGPAPTGPNPSPTIREIDVFGRPTSTGPDDTNPQISSLTPPDGASAVSPAENLSVNFDELVKKGSGEIIIRNLDLASQTVLAIGGSRVSVSGSTLVIDPLADLDPETNYAIRIASTGVVDLAGNPFAGILDESTWNFRTGSFPFVVSAPVTRQVVQRDGSNLGIIPVEGSVGGPVDRVEARAVAPATYDKDLGAIWFIGDSITQANYDGDPGGSPRKSLYDLLAEDEANFSFTGHWTASVDGLPATGGTPSTNLYHYHSGISGSVIGASGGRLNMTANIPSWWNSARLATTKPEIVLVMLGTNDINLNADVADAPNRIRTLVDTVMAQVGEGDPDPAIFLAQIPPINRSAADLQRVIDFNDELPGVVEALQNEGNDVTLVDQFTPINADIAGLMQDSLHTNSAGNEVLAMQWFEAIKARFAITDGATTTPWQTIATNPSGSFSGNLTGVAAGGWYEVEVRTVTDDTPVETLTIEKIGVGDIYVTCGQSNSANFGSPAGTVEDDRVSAWNHLTGAWTKAADPMPGARGGGGSVWTRLGDLLAARDDVPIAFACLGVGGTRVDQWVPPGGNYPRVRTAMEAFPVQGFRAVLWHQGESDSLAFTNPATYQSRLESLIAGSRNEAGWAVPWFIAEAAFHPGSNLSREEPVVAGQRRAIFNDPLVHAGPVTDDFHLEGKLSDGVHFNGAGLADHALQWAAVLGGTPALTPKNGDFEANQPLADGTTAVINANINSSPSVIGWRVLAPSGEAVANGSGGTFNPDDSTYAGAGDTGANGGVLPGMSGKHAAFLSGSSAGPHFLQTRRVVAQPSTTYTLTVALGVRNNPADFGSARLEILRDGLVAAGADFDKAALDALRGDDSAGTFTDAQVSWTSSATMADNPALAIRIIKKDGAGTVLDFDQVRFTAETGQDFGSWISDPVYGLEARARGFHLDPDLDGLPNGVEAWFGTNPGEFDSGLLLVVADGTGTTLIHPKNENLLSGLSAFYQWSPDLENWYDSASGPADGATVTFAPVSSDGTTTVSAVASEPLGLLFLRVRAIQN